jgi:hypothetical protein
MRMSMRESMNVSGSTASHANPSNLICTNTRRKHGVFWCVCRSRQHKK